jgi:hypothetical protein
MIGYQSSIERPGSGPSRTSAHAMPPLLPGVGGAVSGTSTVVSGTSTAVSGTSTA